MATQNPQTGGGLTPAQKKEISEMLAAALAAQQPAQQPAPAAPPAPGPNVVQRGQNAVQNAQKKWGARTFWVVLVSVLVGFWGFLVFFQNTGLPFLSEIYNLVGVLVLAGFTFALALDQVVDKRYNAGGRIPAFASMIFTGGVLALYFLGWLG